MHYKEMEHLYIFGKDTNELTKEQSFFFFPTLY